MAYGFAYNTKGIDLEKNLIKSSHLIELYYNKNGTTYHENKNFEVLIYYPCPACYLDEKVSSLKVLIN
jgi:hypothetical protein